MQNRFLLVHFFLWDFDRGLFAAQQVIRKIVTPARYLLGFPEYQFSNPDVAPAIRRQQFVGVISTVRALGVPRP
jgi:hypothetical protein